MSGKRKQVTPTAPFESAPIIADGALKKHAWERAISLAPAAFACSIHRYGLTAANCSCHEAGRHQVQYKTQMASLARLEKPSLHPSVQQQAAENSKQQEDQKQTTSRYPAGAGCASCGKTESINPDQHWASPTHTLSTQTTNNKRTRKTWEEHRLSSNKLVEKEERKSRTEPKVKLEGEEGEKLEANLQKKNQRQQVHEKSITVAAAGNGRMDIANAKKRTRDMFSNVLIALDSGQEAKQEAQVTNQARLDQTRPEQARGVRPNNATPPSVSTQALL
ncbi:hypothetical protein T06_5303 [Trichinella sp. T6]|nr:hypothetical protein T06_5303 [Trichinella sp. T6]